MDLKALPELVFAHLNKAEQGSDEPYVLTKEALSKIEVLIKGFLGGPDFDQAAKDIFRVAYILDKRFSSPNAARALLNLTLRFADPELVYRSEEKGPVSESTWRRLLGSDRGLPETDEEKKKKGSVGRKFWEIK